jgi:hypothetical protein
VLSSVLTWAELSTYASPGAATKLAAPRRALAGVPAGY